MDIKTDPLLRQVSPAAEPSTTAHSRTLSKATVVSTNLASVGETHLGTSTPGTTIGGSAVDRQPPLNVSTPRRRPSFIEQPTQQLPTPRGSLQWPSTHRSYSSAAATRDSSRHSQATDRVNTAGLNISTSASQHGRAPSSTCHTPMSSRDEQSDRRSSAFSGGGGRGGMRRGHSLSSHHAAPPLVDVGDSPSQGQHSNSHSVCTTGLCTPRENTAAPVHGHSASHFLQAGNLSAALSVGGPRSIVTPAPPPLDDFEAEAQTLTREELEERVEQMRGDNVVLRTSVLRLRESLATLQEGMRANYADLERRQDHIANVLLRRLEATKRRRSKLLAHLRAVEAEKASQEAKLRNTTQSIKDLSKHLKREEQVIANRLQARLQKLHTQRQQLDRVLEEQTSSLQQLEQLVQEVEEMDTGDSGAVMVETGGPDGASFVPALSTNNQGSVLAAAEAPANDSAVATSTTIGSLPPHNTNSSLAGAAGGIPAAGAAAAAVATGGSGFVGIASAPAASFHERSSSRLSVTSSTAGTTATTTAATTADVAYDPTAMIRYLEEEIAAAEALRADAMSKADQYVATRERLERRLAKEKERRTEQETRTAALRRELRDASTAVNERVAAQETAMEMEVDRHLNSSRLGGDILSSASSTCATPKLRTISVAASRGNSVSPCMGRLGIGAGGSSISGAETGAEVRPSTDAFLLPSSSFSALPPAVSAGASHSDVPGAGMMGSLVGGAAVGGSSLSGVQQPLPHMSSSSVRLHTSASRDETTASSEGTPHATRLLVQDTSRMAAPRPVTSADSTPRRTPLLTPKTSLDHGPAL